MPKQTVDDYSAEDFEELTEQLQGLVEFFRATAEKLKRRPGRSMAIAGESSRKNGLKSLRTFKKFTEDALGGDGPKQGEKKAPPKPRSSRVSAR